MFVGRPYLVRGAYTWTNTTGQARAGGTRERGLSGALARDIPFSPVQSALESTRDGGGAGGAGMIGASVAVAVGRSDDEIVGEVLRA